MNNNIIDNIKSTINNIYDKSGFLDKYGGSLWLTVLIGLVFFVAISYYYIYNNLQPIKADWLNQRCNPMVIPFAGLINRPDNMSAYDFTAENFNYCIQTILQDIVGVFLAPIYYLVNVLNKVLSGISEAIQAIRKLMDSIRNSLSNVSSEIMGRSLNIMIPVQQIVMKIKDLLSKSQGVMTTSIFTLLGAYDTLRSVIGSIVGIVVAILISIGVLIYALFVIPFGFGIPFAIPLLVMFILIAVPGIMVYIIQVMILKKMVSPIPGL
jgi:phage-related protein